MSERGVFAVDRGFFDHPLFPDEPFTEREAWLWLVAEAAWKPRYRRVAGRVVKLDRGQLAASFRFMAERWKWSLGHVQRFVQKLVDADTVTHAVSDTGLLVLTVCNYARYQRVAIPDDTDMEADTGTAPIQSRYSSDTVPIQTKDIKTIVIEGESAAPARTDDFPPDFRERLWEAYGKPVEKKLGMAALEAVRRSGRVTFAQLLDAMLRQAEHVERQYRPSLERWLKREKWHDEYPTGPPLAVVSNFPRGPNNRSGYGQDRQRSTIDILRRNIADDELGGAAEPLRQITRQ